MRVVFSCKQHEKTEIREKFRRKPRNAFMVMTVRAGDAVKSQRGTFFWGKWRAELITS